MVKWTEAGILRPHPASLNFMFRDFLFAILFFGFISQFSAQVNFVDSIRVSLTKKPKLIGALSSHNTFIDNINSPIYNIKAGLNFKNLFRVGMGYAFLKRPYKVDKIINASGVTVLADARLTFSYVNFFAEYVFYKTSKWEFSVPLFFGIGNSSLKYSYNNQAIQDSRRLILLYEPVISGQYKVLSWLGVGGDVGYRLMLVNNRSIGNRFNSPVYSLGTVIFFSTLKEKLKMAWKSN